MIHPSQLVLLNFRTKTIKNSWQRFTPNPTFRGGGESKP